MSCLAKRLPTGSGTDILTMLLYTRKRTWISTTVMSALCQKRTLPLYSFAVRLAAQPRNADTCDAIAQTFRARGPNQSG
jgi:hypothetical protein